MSAGKTWVVRGAKTHPIAGLGGVGIYGALASLVGLLLARGSGVVFFVAALLFVSAFAIATAARRWVFDRRPAVRLLPSR